MSRFTSLVLIQTNKKVKHYHFKKHISFNNIIHLNMKTLKSIAIVILCLLFQLPVTGQQNTSNTNASPQPTNVSKDDDDDDDDDDDEDEDEDEEDEVIKHPSLYFVKLAPGISQQEVNRLLEELNSEEIWYREEINLRLWNTIAFPYITAQGQTVTNIDGQVQTAQGKTEINGINFNAGSIDRNPPGNFPLSCFQDIIPQQPLGTASIKISVFDTGFTPQPTNPNGYSFNIQNYTGYDYIDDDNTPEDGNGHGTHIAGVIHHLLSQQGGLANISFDIRKTHDDMGRGFVSNLIPAILDAVNEGSDILNLSFSYQNINENPNGKPLKTAIDYAEQMGALVIAAAGNTNENNDTDAIISFPASYPNNNILSVASADCNGKLSPFSSFGQRSVDVAVLGENIPGPIMTGGMGYQTGTSFATANVTAMAAILATHQQQFDQQQIRCALINTSTTSSDLFEKVVANGAINFTAAFTQLGAACTSVTKATTGAVQQTPTSTLFPNPFRETLQLDIDIKEKDRQHVTVSMYNQQGILILQDQFNTMQDNTVINWAATQQLRPGTYFAKVDIGGHTTTQMVIKK